MWGGVSCGHGSPKSSQSLDLFNRSIVFFQLVDLGIPHCKKPVKKIRFITTRYHVPPGNMKPMLTPSILTHGNSVNGAPCTPAVHSYYLGVSINGGSSFLDGLHFTKDNPLGMDERVIPGQHQLPRDPKGSQGPMGCCLGASCLRGVFHT